MSLLHNLFFFFLSIWFNFIIIILLLMLLINSQLLVTRSVEYWCSQRKSKLISVKARGVLGAGKCWMVVKAFSGIIVCAIVCGDGLFLADGDCWEGWWSILACSLVAVETDSWCAPPYRTLDRLRFGRRMVGMLLVESRYGCVAVSAPPPLAPPALT